METKRKAHKKTKQFLLNISFDKIYMWIVMMLVYSSVSATTTISCNGDPSHSCSTYNSISSISVSAPSSANAGSVVNVKVDWTGWHWYDPNHFAIYMKPTIGGSWNFIDSCTTFVSDSGTNYYTMNCPITIPSIYSGDYYIKVTGNDYFGYCDPGESGVDAEGQTTITISGCIPITPGVAVIGNEDKCYKYFHTGGSAWITLTMDSSVDYDLYTKWDGTIPSESNWDCRPWYGNWVTETCNKDNLSSGAYYVYVKKYSGSGGFEIRYDTNNTYTGCYGTSWAPKYWTSADEIYRNSSHVIYHQCFEWDTTNFNNFTSSDRTSFEQEYRRNSDVWDFYWIHDGYCWINYWTNIPNDNPWGSEENDVDLTLVCSAYPWCRVPGCFDEEAEINSEKENYQANTWYGSCVRLIRKNPNNNVKLVVEAEAERDINFIPPTVYPSWNCEMHTSQENS